MAGCPSAQGLLALSLEGAFRDLLHSHHHHCCSPTPVGTLITVASLPPWGLCLRLVSYPVIRSSRTPHQGSHPCSALAALTTQTLNSKF